MGDTFSKEYAEWEAGYEAGYRECKAEVCKILKKGLKKINA